MFKLLRGTNSTGHVHYKDRIRESNMSGFSCGVDTCWGEKITVVSGQKEICQ